MAWVNVPGSNGLLEYDNTASLMAGGMVDIDVSQGCNGTIAGGIRTFTPPNGGNPQKIYLKTRRAGETKILGELSKNYYDGYEVLPQGYYGVSAPELQWVMSAQSGASVAVNTAIDLSNGEDTVYTGTWTSLVASTVNSYSNSAGATKYYLPLTSGSNLKTSVATSSNSDIISNGGYTVWLTLIPHSTRTSWHRLWNYWNLASISTASTVGFADAYKGPLLFTQTYNNRIMYKRPSATIHKDGDWAMLDNIVTDNTGVLTLILRTTSSGDTTLWVRNGTYSVDAASQTHVFDGVAGGYGIRTVANSATPVFADAYYPGQGETFTGVMESGFANRPFTDAECQTLADGLNDEFKR